MTTAQHETVVSTTQRPGCHGKREYETFAIAERMAKRTRRQWHSKVAPYKCRACGKYHVGEMTDTTPTR